MRIPRLRRHLNRGFLRHSYKHQSEGYILLLAQLVQPPERNLYLLKESLSDGIELQTDHRVNFILLFKYPHIIDFITGTSIQQTLVILLVLIQYLVKQYMQYLVKQYMQYLINQYIQYLIKQYMQYLMKQFMQYFYFDTVPSVWMRLKVPLCPGCQYI